MALRGLPTTQCENCQPVVEMIDSNPLMGLSLLRWLCKLSVMWGRFCFCRRESYFVVQEMNPKRVIEISWNGGIMVNLDEFAVY